MAKLAVTPPVVGSVITEMYGILASSSRASPALIFAICISDTIPSIIRAPPDAATIISGFRVASERSTARAIVSPTTAPMLPPMNPYSIALAVTACGPSIPTAFTIASFSPVFLRASASRCS